MNSTSVIAATVVYCAFYMECNSALNAHVVACVPAGVVEILINVARDSRTLEKWRELRDGTSYISALTARTNATTVALNEA